MVARLHHCATMMNRATALRHDCQRVPLRPDASAFAITSADKTRRSTSPASRWRQSSGASTSCLHREGGRCQRAFFTRDDGGGLCDSKSEDHTLVLVQVQE